MRKRQKQINFLLLFSLFIWLFHPISIVADDEKDKGKLKIKKERIIKEDSPLKHFGKTELDIRFPNLFTEEVHTKIEEKQNDDTQQMEQIKEIVLVENIDTGHGNTKVKSSLFTDDYTTSFTQQVSTEEEEQQGLTSTVLFYASILLIISVIVSVIYAISRKLRS